MFRLRCLPGFVPEMQVYDGIEFLPSSATDGLMGRYAIRMRQLPSGVELYYQTLPQDLSLIPLRPIAQETVLRFFIRIKDPSFSTLADVRDWQADRIFVLNNTVYQTTGEVEVLNGPMQDPAIFHPLKWKHRVELQAVPSVVVVRNAGGIRLLTLAVRARDGHEDAGVRDEVLIDITRYGEGSYTVHHEYAGAPPPQAYFCSPDHRPGILAVVNIRYQYGAGWTGLPPELTFLIKVPARAADWFYKVHIKPSNRSLYPADQLLLLHRPQAAEPAITFSVDGTPDNASGTVTFRSDASIPFPASPMHLDLVRQPASVVLPRLPMPQPGQVVWHAGQFATSVIINI